MSLKNKMSDAFAASLSFSTSSNSYKSITDEDEKILKNANVSIYDPTPENIKEFVTKYTLNEMKQYPSVRIKGIDLESYEKDSEGVAGVVDRAVGEVKISVGSAELILPFHIISGEFVPFDVIKLKAQRIPYSRENLNRIISEILKKENLKEEKTEDFSPFVNVAKPVNPATSLGFLGDVLQIRDAQGNNNSSSGSHYVTASEDINVALEKIANLKSFDGEDERKLREIIEKKVLDANIEYLEKSAEVINEAPDMTDTSMKIYDKVKRMPLRDVRKFNHGDIVHLPIYEKGEDADEVSMEKGVVISDFLHFKDKELSSFKFLITEDGKLLNLDSNDPVMGIKVENDNSFRMVPKNFDSLQAGDMFFGYEERVGKATPMFRLNMVEQQGKNGSFSMITAPFYGEELPSSTALGDDALKRYTLEPLAKTNINKEYFLGQQGQPPLMNSKDKPQDFDVYLLDNAQFSTLSVKDFVDKISKQLARDEVSIMKAIEYGNKDSNSIVATSPDTKIIKVTGFLNGYLKSADELERVVNRAHSDDTVSDSMNKVAADITNSKAYIEIRSVGQEEPTYNVTVFAKVDSSMVFNMEKREFKGLDHAQVRELMMRFNVPSHIASSMMTKAKTEGYAKVTLDKDANLNILKGGDLKLKSNEIIEKIKDGLFNKENAHRILTHLTQSAVSGALAGAGVGDPGLIALADESEALSNVFEKLAMENKSESMLKVATLMNLTTRVYQRIDEALKGESFATFKEDVLSKVASSEDYLCKMAHEMIELKEAQYKESVNIVNPNYISRSVYHMDNLYKIAKNA